MLPKKGFQPPQRELCESCTKPVFYMERICVDAKVFHKFCFKCKTCKKTLSAGNYASLHGQVYCKAHFKQLFRLKGNYDEGFGHQQRKYDWVKGAAGAGASSPQTLAASTALEASQELNQAKALPAIKPKTTETDVSTKSSQSEASTEKEKPKFSREALKPLHDTKKSTQTDISSAPPSSPASPFGVSLRTVSKPPAVAKFYKTTTTSFEKQHRDTAKPAELKKVAKDAAAVEGDADKTVDASRSGTSSNAGSTKTIKASVAHSETATIPSLSPSPSSKTVVRGVAVTQGTVAARARLFGAGLSATASPARDTAVSRNGSSPRLSGSRSAVSSTAVSPQKELQDTAVEQGSPRVRQALRDAALKYHGDHTCATIQADANINASPLSRDNSKATLSPASSTSSMVRRSSRIATNTSPSVRDAISIFERLRCSTPSSNNPQPAKVSAIRGQRVIKTIAHDIEESSTDDTPVQDHDEPETVVVVQEENAQSTSPSTPKQLILQLGDACEDQTTVDAAEHCGQKDDSGAASEADDEAETDDAADTINASMHLDMETTSTLERSVSNMSTASWTFTGPDNQVRDMTSLSAADAPLSTARGVTGGCSPIPESDDGSTAEDESMLESPDKDDCVDAGAATLATRTSSFLDLSFLSSSRSGSGQGSSLFTFKAPGIEHHSMAFTVCSAEPIESTPRVESDTENAPMAPAEKENVVFSRKSTSGKLASRRRSSFLDLSFLENAQEDTEGVPAMTARRRSSVDCGKSQQGPLLRRHSSFVNLDWLF